MMTVSGSPPSSTVRTDAGGSFQGFVERLHAQGVFARSERQSIDFALEGGGIETDGAGTLLSTWRCLHERHPQASREELTARLSDWLRQDRVLWLDHGQFRGRGKPDGSLHEVTALRLAETALRALKVRNGLDTALVDDVILGQGYSNGESPAIGRIAALDAFKNAPLPS